MFRNLTVDLNDYDFEKDQIMKGFGWIYEKKKKCRLFTYLRLNTGIFDDLGKVLHGVRWKQNKEKKLCLCVDKDGIDNLEKEKVQFVDRY